MTLEDKLLGLVGVEKFTPGFERLDHYFSEFKERFKKRNIKIVTVAGTNGKGETALNIAQGFESLGKKTALFTSPHILSVTERFIFNGQQVDESRLGEMIDVLPAGQMSYFEYLLYLFCLLVLKEVRVDYIVLEVGLGGRLDATNYFDTDFAVITSISRDHQELLGRRYDQILKEKLEIAREDGELVTSFELNYLRNLAGLFSKGRNINHRDLFSLGFCSSDDDYSTRNRALAHFVVEILENRAPCLNDASSKGRFEEMTSGRNRFIFVGAHNLDGLRKTLFLMERDADLNNYLPIISFSKRNERDLAHMVRAVKDSTFGKSARFCIFKHPKALEKEAFDALIRKEGMRAPLDLSELVRKIKFVENKRYIVFGSYYFIGEFQKQLQSINSTC